MSSSNKMWQVKILFVLASLFCLVFASMLFLQASRPLYDSDFWWHLKTGEMTVQNGGLLQSDPYSFHDNSEYPLREKNALVGYWMWQVSAYTLYAFLGFNGILLHNVLITFTMAATILWQFHRQRISICLSAPLLLAGFCLLSYYPLERPQIFSFFFAILLVGMLLSLRRGGQLGVALPIMMCLWANVHGGFVLGSLILFCFSIGVIIEYRHNLSRMKKLLIWVFSGVAATLVNPNGAAIYLELFNFQNINLMHKVTEYQTTWKAFGNGMWVYALLWGLIILYFLAVLILRQVFWPEFMIAVFLAYVSTRYSRNAPFFALAMLPAIGWSWQEILKRWRLPGAQVVALVTMSFAIVTSLWFVQVYWKNWDPNVKVQTLYPEAAVRFLEETGMQGRMFNSYEYGGYLLWRLAPKSKIFIDGRAINPSVFSDYEKISSAKFYKVNGRNEYEALLDSYEIDYIIQPIYDGLGNVQPLMKTLLSNPKWMPIYLDRQVYILANPENFNADVVRDYRIDKDEFKKRLLLIYNQLSRTYPQEVGFRVARAGMLIYLRDYDAAKDEIEIISTMSPEDPSLPTLRRDLQIIGWRRSKS